MQGRMKFAYADVMKASQRVASSISLMLRTSVMRLCLPMPPVEKFVTIFMYLTDLSKSLVIGEMGSSPIPEKKECVLHNARVMTEKAHG